MSKEKIPMETIIVRVVEGSNQSMQTGKEGFILGQKMFMLIKNLNDLAF